MKEKIKFAFLPKKINGKFIWFRKYKNIYEYKELKKRVMMPVENISDEYGNAIYDKRFSKYEWYKYNKWVRIDRRLIMNKKKDLTERDIFKILKKFTVECVHGGDFDQGNTLKDTLSVLKTWWNKEKNKYK